MGFIEIYHILLGMLEGEEDRVGREDAEAWMEFLEDMSDGELSHANVLLHT